MSLDGDKMPHLVSSGFPVALSYALAVSCCEYYNPVYLTRPDFALVYIELLPIINIKETF